MNPIELQVSREASVWFGNLPPAEKTRYLQRVSSSGACSQLPLFLSREYILTRFVEDLRYVEEETAVRAIFQCCAISFMEAADLAVSLVGSAERLGELLSSSLEEATLTFYCSCSPRRETIEWMAENMPELDQGRIEFAGFTIQDLLNRFPPDSAEFWNGVLAIPEGYRENEGSFQRQISIPIDCVHLVRDPAALALLLRIGGDMTDYVLFRYPEDIVLRCGLPEELTETEEDRAEGLQFPRSILLPELHQYISKLERE